MAKAPSAKVPKTSGQGVSRLSYQKGYALGNRGGAAPAGGKSPSVSTSTTELKSSRGGGKAGIDKAGGINVSYGDTLFPTDLEDVRSVAKRQPAKSPGFLKLGKKPSYKAGKNDSGFVKGKK
jgi:hypothetical protein